jgi:hypothetical protein
MDGFRLGTLTIKDGLRVLTFNPTNLPLGLFSSIRTRPKERFSRGFVLFLIDFGTQNMTGSKCSLTAGRLGSLVARHRLMSSCLDV